MTNTQNANQNDANANVRKQLELLYANDPIALRKVLIAAGFEKENPYTATIKVNKQGREYAVVQIAGALASPSVKTARQIVEQIDQFEMAVVEAEKLQAMIDSKKK